MYFKRGDIKMSYGEFMHKHRLLSGYKSQRRLADKSGVTSATISRIEAEIQKPQPETLRQLAPYLTSTTLVELMVECGYWDKGELLEEEINKPNSKYTNNGNEEEFIEKIDLTDEEILKQFELVIDDKKLTEKEARGIIAYIRSLRQMED
jgi:transcriptional regulator with XRE-family HTH domain